MQPQTQETKLENLRIHSAAKAKVTRVVAAIHKEKRIKPTLSEAVTIMADHYLSSSRPAPT
jgi:hypothetical protein